MTKKAWKTRIKKACKEAGTYRKYFDSVIDTLSAILEKRDQAQQDFDESGEGLIVEHTNKAGATNYEQNPTIRLINDLNRDALAYWRDLGLTPAGLRKINEAAIRTEEQKSELEKALEKLGA